MLQIAIFAALFLVVGGGISCGCQQHSRLSMAQQQKFLSTVRYSASDSVQAIRSAHYFKLMGRLDLALKELTEASERDPQNSQLLNVTGSCYDELGYYAKAREFYEKALTVDSNNLSALNNLGYSNYLAGNYAAAESYFQSVLAKNPQNTLARNNLGLLYCRQGQADRALNLWQQAEGEKLAKEKLHNIMAKLGQHSNLPGGTGKPEEIVVAQSQSPKPQPSLSQSTRESPKQATTKDVPPAIAPSETAPANKPRELAVKPEEKSESSIRSANMTRVETAKPTVPAVKFESGPAATTNSSIASTGEHKAVPKESAAPVLSLANNSQGINKKAEVVVSPLMSATQPGTPDKASPTAKPKLPQAISAESKVITDQPKADDSAWEDLDIEIRNGNGAPEIASLTRDLLKDHGLQVKAIANHIDFGVPETIISYRPGFERVADDLLKRFFRTARKTPADNLKEGIDVRVLLGHDLLQPGQIFAHLKSTYPINEKGPEGAFAMEQGGSSIPAAAQSRPANVMDAASRSAIMNTSALAAPTVGNPIEPNENNDRPRSKFIEITPPSTALSAAGRDLQHVAIEVRNGTWTENLARRIRDLLKAEGLKTAAIGNHIDFGVQETIIYYRSGQENQANELNKLLFKAKRLKVTDELNPGIDIKVLLGADIFQNNPNLSHLQGRKP